MNTQLLVRVLPRFSLSRSSGQGGGRLEWCWLNGSGTINGKVLFGTLMQLADWYDEQTDYERELPVTMLVSGDISSCYRKELLEGQRKHWQQALPYLLEEQLATDIDNVHIVAVADTDQESISAGWITRANMDDLMATFAEIGITPQQVLPEAQFFESSSGLLSAWLEGDTSYLAAPDNYGQQVDSSALEILLPGLLEDDDDSFKDDLSVSLDDEEEGEAPDSSQIAAGMRVFYIRQSSLQAEELAGVVGVSTERIQLPNDSLLFAMLPILHTRSQNRQLIDLCSGSYQGSSSAAKMWRQWRAVVSLALFWIATEMLINIAGGFYYQHQAQQLTQENLATYRELRPNDKRTVDVQHGLTQFLKNAATADVAPVFLDMLLKVSAVGTSGFSKTTMISDLDYNAANGRMTLNVRAESFEALNRFAQALRSQNLQIDVENGNQDSLGVSARLVVRNA